MEDEPETSNIEHRTAVRVEAANFKRFRELIDQWTDAAFKLSRHKTRLGRHSGES